MPVIKSLYNDYVQKSGIFLYPALGIPRGVSITPIQTYVAWEQFGIDKTDKRFICLYHHRDDQEFKDFEKSKLKGNKLFELAVPTEDNTIAYIFDMRKGYNSDWPLFIEGLYSKLSAPLKRRVKDFYKNKNGSNDYVYVESYLHPDKYFVIYSQLLSVSVETLKEVGQLCSSPDFDKETLRIKVLTTSIKIDSLYGNK